jgi:hypothetical protein
MKFSKAWNNATPKKARDLRRKPTTVKKEIDKLKQPEKKPDGENNITGGSK